MAQYGAIRMLRQCVIFMLLLREAAAVCNAKELGTSRWSMPAKLSHGLDLYINRGVEYSLSRAFTDVFVHLNLTDEDSYDIYKGENCSIVEENFYLDNRAFGLFKSVRLWKNHQLSVFNDTVVGIATRLPYTVQVEITDVNYIRLGVFLCGILLFFFAKPLVRNAVFFYGSGCTFGLLASLLIIVFIVYRIAPGKRLIGLPILVGGWSFSMYIIHFVWKNFSTLAIQHQNYLIAYFVTVMAISFAVCYKRGPPTDSRSHDIAQWTLQGISLLLIYCSSQVYEVSVAVITFLLVHYSTRSWLWSLVIGVAKVFGFMWRRISPPKQRLLTVEEYEKQGQEVTKRELERLREYCKSPEADAWKMTNKVKNFKRLARFVGGMEDHVNEEEEELHEEECEDMCYNDYEEIDDDEDDLNVVSRNLSSEEINDDDWEEEVVIRRRPRNRRASQSSLRDLSYRRSAAMSLDGLQPVELPVLPRSSYHEGRQKKWSSSKHSDSISPSRRTDKSYVNAHDSPSYRKHGKRQDPIKATEKRPVKSSSNEFISSDSEPDIQDPLQYH